MVAAPASTWNIPKSVFTADGVDELNAQAIKARHFKTTRKSKAITVDITDIITDIPDTELDLSEFIPRASLPSAPKLSRGGGIDEDDGFGEDDGFDGYDGDDGFGGDDESGEATGGWWD